MYGALVLSCQCIERPLRCVFELSVASLYVCNLAISQAQARVEASNLETVRLQEEIQSLVRRFPTMSCHVDNCVTLL